MKAGRGWHCSDKLPPPRVSRKSKTNGELVAEYVRVIAQDGRVIMILKPIAGQFHERAVVLQQNALLRRDHLEGPGVVGRLSRQARLILLQPLPAPDTGLKPGPGAECRPRHVREGSADGGAREQSRMRRILPVDEKIDSSCVFRLMPIQRWPIDKVHALVLTLRLVSRADADVAVCAGARAILRLVLGQVQIDAEALAKEECARAVYNHGRVSPPSRRLGRSQGCIHTLQVEKIRQRAAANRRPK